jgi:hypothetical protein
MHPSISAELYYLLEHNPEFCTHTIDVWKPEGMPSIQLFHSPQHVKYFSNGLHIHYFCRISLRLELVGCYLVGFLMIW